MSYINKRTRAFDKGPVEEVVHIRSEGRMKNYPSAQDIRAWSDTVEERRQHILEYMAKNRRGTCPDKMIPLDILIDAMMAQKNSRIKKLEKRIEYLEKLLDIYSQLDLTPEQMKKLDELKKNIEEANAELDSLKSERDKLETVYDRRKRRSDEYPGGKPKKRDKKRPSQRGESEGADSTKRAQRKKKARVPSKEIPGTSGDEEIPAPKKYKGKKKSLDEKKGGSLPEKPTDLVGEVSKKDKPIKRKAVPTSIGDSSRRKKDTSATAVEDKDATGATKKSVSEPSEEPRPIQEPAFQKEMRPRPVVIQKKQPMSDTEYELHPEKSRGTKTIPDRKEKTDVRIPRPKSPMKLEPEGSGEITKGKRKVPKSPVMKKGEEPLTGGDNSMDTEGESPKRVGVGEEASKDNKRLKPKNVPGVDTTKKSIESKPKKNLAEAADTPPKRDKRLPESERKLRRQVSASTDGETPVQEKSSKAKPENAKDIPPKSTKAKPKSTTPKKEKIIEGKKPVEKDIPEDKPLDKGEKKPVEKTEKEKPQADKSVVGKSEKKNIVDEQSATPQKAKTVKTENPQIGETPVETVETAEQQPKQNVAGKSATPQKAMTGEKKIPQIDERPVETVRTAEQQPKKIVVDGKSATPKEAKTVEKETPQISERPVEIAKTAEQQPKKKKQGDDEQVHEKIPVQEKITAEKRREYGDKTPLTKSSPKEHEEDKKKDSPKSTIPNDEENKVGGTNRDKLDSGKGRIPEVIPTKTKELSEPSDNTTELKPEKTMTETVDLSKKGPKTGDETSKEVSKSPTEQKSGKKLEKKKPLDELESKEVNKIPEEMIDSKKPAKESKLDGKKRQEEPIKESDGANAKPMTKKLTKVSEIQENVTPKVSSAESDQRKKEKQPVEDDKPEEMRKTKQLTPEPQESPKVDKEVPRKQKPSKDEPIESEKDKRKPLEMKKLPEDIKEGPSISPKTHELQEKEKPIEAIDSKNETEKSKTREAEKKLFKTPADEAIDTKKTTEKSETPEAEDKVIKTPADKAIDSKKTMKQSETPEAKEKVFKTPADEAIDKKRTTEKSETPEAKEKVFKTPADEVSKIVEPEKPKTKEIKKLTGEKSESPKQEMVDDRDKTNASKTGEPKEPEQMEIDRIPIIEVKQSFEGIEIPIVEEILPETIEHAEEISEKREMQEKQAEAIPEERKFKGKTEEEPTTMIKPEVISEEQKLKRKTVKQPATIMKPEVIPEEQKLRGKTEEKPAAIMEPTSEEQEMKRKSEEEPATMMEPKVIAKDTKLTKQTEKEPAAVVEPEIISEEKKLPRKTERVHETIMEPEVIAEEQKLKRKTEEKPTTIMEPIPEERDLKEKLEKKYDTVVEPEVIPEEEKMPKRSEKEPVTITEAEVMSEEKILSGDMKPDEIQETSYKYKEGPKREKFPDEPKVAEESPQVLIEDSNDIVDEMAGIPEGIQMTEEEEKEKRRIADDSDENIFRKIEFKLPPTRISEHKSIAEGGEEPGIDKKLVPYDETDEEMDLVEYAPRESAKTEPQETTEKFEAPEEFKKIPDEELEGGLERTVASKVAKPSEARKGKEKQDRKLARGEEKPAKSEEPIQVKTDGKESFEDTEISGEEKGDEGAKESLEADKYMATEEGKTSKPEETRLSKDIEKQIPMKHEEREIPPDVKPHIKAEGVVDIPADELDDLGKAEQLKIDEEGRMQRKRESQRDVQVQQPEYRCAALIRHAKERCAAMASRSGGIVALPNLKRGEQDLIPTGYWPGEVLPELLPPQQISRVPDWVRQREISTGGISKEDRNLQLGDDDSVGGSSKKVIEPTRDDEKKGNIVRDLATGKKGGVDADKKISKDRADTDSQRVDGESQQVKKTKCRALCSKTIDQSKRKWERKDEDEPINVTAGETSPGFSPGHKESNDLRSVVPREVELGAGLNERHVVSPEFVTKPVSGQKKPKDLGSVMLRQEEVGIGMNERDVVSPEIVSEPVSSAASKKDQMKVCRAICSRRGEEKPPRELPTQHISRQLKKISEQEIKPLIDYSSDLSSEVVTPRDENLVNDRYTQNDGENVKKSKEKKYTPKLELAWEEVDFDEQTEDDNTFDGKALMGSRISRVLSGDASGFGTATFPVALSGSKTLSGEILQKRISDKMLQKKSSERKESQPIVTKLPEEETHIEKDSMITRQQISPRDTELQSVPALSAEDESHPGKEDKEEKNICGAMRPTSLEQQLDITVPEQKITIEKKTPPCRAICGRLPEDEVRLRSEETQQTQAEFKSTMTESEEAPTPSEETNILEPTTPVVEPVIEKTVIKYVSTQEPVIKLFERGINLDRDVTSDEQIIDSISGEVRAELDDVIDSLDYITVKEETCVPEKLANEDIGNSELKDVTGQPLSVGTGEDESQHGDVDQTTSKHSQHAVTIYADDTVAQIPEIDEFMSAIDTSTTQDEDTFEDTPGQQAAPIPEPIEIKRSEEEIDLPSVIANAILEPEKEIPVVELSPEDEQLIVEEVTASETMAADQPEVVQTSNIENIIIEVETPIEQVLVENIEEEPQISDESVIIEDIVEESVAVVSETMAGKSDDQIEETPLIIGYNALSSPDNCEITLKDFEESLLDGKSEEDDHDAIDIVELYYKADDNYTPRVLSLKSPLELAGLQMNESIVQDTPSQVITEDFIPRATAVESTNIMEDISDRVVDVEEVPTPGEVNRMLDDRMLPLPMVLPSTQQVPMAVLPQVVPETFRTVPRAVMPEFIPAPVPASTGFFPCLFGKKRSTTCIVKKDSVSQTDELKLAKSTETVCPKTGLLCDCCKKNMAPKQMVCKGTCATVEPEKNICRGPCRRSGVRQNPEEKQYFDRNQDELERRMISATPKDSKEDLPTLIIHKDAEIIALRNALAAKESYCAEQRKIASAALEQLENIKNIVEERDDLRKKLESSQDELEELKRNIALGYPFGISETQPSMPTSIGGSQFTTCEEEITALENEINDMRSGKLTPNLEAKVIRKEVEVLKKYCSKLSVIQKENHQLKNQIAKYEDKLNKLGCLGEDDLLEDLKDKLDTFNDTVKERDELKCKCNKLEKELLSYLDLPEDIEVFKQRSLLLDEVLQDRDRLSKRVEQLRGVDEELYNLRKKSSRVDELEENLKRLSKDKKFQDEELEHLRCKCSFAEIEALNQKAEGDTLKSKIACLEHEVESMKCLCKDKERLKQERDDLQKNLDELVRMQNNFDHMKNQMKCMDMLKKEKDVYKSKYENLVGLECECDILRAQVERAKGIEKERDALENQVEDLETCIADQENEIRRLVCHIDILAKGRDEQQEKLKDVLCTMRAELEKKDNIIKSSEEKLSMVQKELITSIQGLSTETTNLKSKNDSLEKCMCNLKGEKKILENEKQNLEDRLSNLQREKRNSEEERNNLETCLCNLEMTAKTSSEENSLMKVQIANMKKQAEDLDEQMKELTSDNEFLIQKLEEREAYIKSLQDVLKDHEPMLKNLEMLKQTARDDSAKYELEAAKLQQQQQTSVTGDEHLHELLRQSKHAVQRIALELCKQYEEWDCVKNKLKQIKKNDQSTRRSKKCTCCTCLCTCGCACSGDSSTQDRIGGDKGVTVKMMDSTATQDDGVVKDNKAVTATGMDNAGTQFPKDKTSRRSAEKSECQAMKRVEKYDKKSGEVCECVSTGTNCYPDICSALRGQDASKQTQSDGPCDCRNKMKEDKEDVVYSKLTPDSTEGKTDETSQDQSSGIYNAPEIGKDDIGKYEYDVSKWSCKKAVKAEPKDDTSEYELDTSKWSCRQPKPEDYKIEEETEDEMHTARSNEDKCKHLEERIEFLEKELAQANETILKLQDQLAATDRTAAENQALRRHSSEVQEVAKDQIEDLVEHLKKAKERVAFLEEENAKLNELLKNMQLEKDEFMKMIKNLQGETDKELLSELRKELDDCLKEKTALQERISMLEKQLSEDIPEDEKLRDLLAANKTLEERLKNEMDLRQKLESENEVIRKRIAELEQLLSEGDHQDPNELEEMKKKLKDAENKIVELLKAGDSGGIDQLMQKELDELRKKLQEAEGNLKTEREARQKAENAGLLKSDVGMDQDELEKLRKKLKDAEDDLNREIEERKKAENKIAELLNAGDSDLDQMRQKELDDLKRKLKNAEDDLRKQMEEKERAEKKFAELMNAKDSDLDELRRKELDDLKRKLQEAENKIGDADKLRQALEDLRKKLQDAENKLKSSGDTGELDRLKKELDDEKQKSKNFDELMSQIQKLKKEKDDLEKMLASNVMTTSRRSSKMENELDALAKKNKELQDENDRLKKIENDSKDLMQKLSSCKDENKQLKDDLDKTKAELDKLKKQQTDTGIIEALKKENENLLKKLEAQAREISDLLDKMKAPKPVVEVSKSHLERELKEKQTLQSIIADLENQLKNLSRDDKKMQPIGPSDDLEKMIKDLTKRLEDEQKRADAAELALRNMKTSDPSAMLNAEIAKLKKQLADIEGENTNLKQQLTQSVNEAAKLKKDLDAALNDAKRMNDENLQLKQQLSNLQKENGDLKSSVDKLKSGLSGDDFLKSEVKRLNDQIAQLEKDKASLKNEVAQKENEIKNAYDKISKLQNEIADLKQNQVKLQSENDKLKKDLDNASNNAKKDSAKVAQLEDDNAKLRKDIQSLEGELAKVKRDLDSALNSAKKGTSGVSDLQDEISKLKQKINQLETENGNLKRDLNAALDNSKSTAAKLAQVTSENEKLKNAKDAAEDKLAKLQKDLDSANAEARKAASDLGRQQNELAGLKDKLAKLEAENVKLKKDLNTALEDARKGSSLMDEDAKLKQKLAQMENENSKLKKDLERALEEAKKTAGLDKLKDDDNKQRDRIGKLEADNSKLNKDLNAALDNLNKATATISQLQDDQNKLKQKMNSLENDNAQLKKDLNKALDDAKKYASEISALRDSESKLKQRIAQLESENAKLKKDLDTSSADNKSNLNIIQSLKDENNKLKQKAALLEQENSKLKKDLDAFLKDQKIPTPVDDSEKLKAKVSQLEDTNSKLKKDLDNVLDDHKKCPKTISQLQDEIERLKKKIAELEKDGSKWKAQYEGAMGDMKMSNDELNKLRDSESKLKQMLAQVQADNGKLNKDIIALTAELKTTAGNLAVAKDDAAKAKQKIGLLEAENSQLKKNLDGTLDEMKKIQKLLSQLQEENPKLKQRIAQLETENAKLKKDLDAAVADAKKGSSGADQMKSEDAKLRDLLAQLEKENKKLKGDLNNALDQAKKSVADVTKMRDDDSKQKQQIAKLENENAKLKKDLEKALNDALANSSGAQGLRDENNKLKQRVNQLEGEISKLKSDLNAALENAKQGATGLSQMQADDAKLKQRISQLEKDNAKLKGDLEAALNEARAGGDTGTKLRNENSKQKQMISQLEDEIAKLKKNLENALNDSKKGDSGLSNLQDENAKLKQKIGQLEKDNATLKKSLDDALANAKTVSSANTQLTDENGKLKQKVKQLEGDVEKLRKELNSAMDEKKKALANLSAVKDSEAKLKQRIAELESDNIKLKQDLDSASGDAKSGKGDLNKLRDENASLKQKVAQLEEDNSKLKKDLDGALSDSKNRSGEVQKLKDENTKLKQKIADLETVNAKMKKDLDSAMSDSRNAASELAKLKDDIAKLKQSSAQKDTQINELKKKLDDTNDKITELTNENVKLKEKIKDLENQVAKLGNDLAKLKKEIAQKDGQIDELKKNLDKARADNKSKDAKIKDLENKLIQEGTLDESLAKLKEEMGLRDNQVNDLKNRLEKAMSENRKKDGKIKELSEDNEKLKARLKDLENQLGKLNDGLKTANDMAKKAAEDLSKMRGDYDKLKSDNEMLMKTKPDADKIKEYEAKIKQLQAELAKQKKECTDNIASMKEQFDREMKDLLRKNEISIDKLQKAHEEFLKELNERHDKDIKSLQDALKKAKGELDEVTKERDRLKALLDDQRRKSIEIKDKVEQVENIVKKERRKSKEESQKSKVLEGKLDEEMKKSKDLESASFLLRKSIEEQKRKSEELAKEKKEVVDKTSKLEKEKENLERSSLQMQKSFEEEKRKSEELTKDLENLKKKISEISSPTEKKEEHVSETVQPVPVEKSKEPLKMETFKTFSTDAAMPDVIAITTPLSAKELKFFGKTSCSCEPNLDSVLEKLGRLGIDALGIEELQLLHTKICDVTANVLAEIGQSSGVLKPNENDKLGLLRRIASLEGDLLKKQKHAQQKVIAMQYAVKLEKERLSDLRKSLDEEKMKNSELLNQIGSQSKVVSNIQEERDLIQRQKSYHEQKLEQYLVAVEEERGKSRNLEDELEKEKSNNQHLKSLLEAERSRSRQNKRKDTEALEAMRIKLEKTVNSEMMLRMKLQEKTCHRHPSPHTFTPVRDNQPSSFPRQSTSRTRAAFYTDLSPGDGKSRTCTKRTFSSHSGGHSGSSNGLDLEDK